MIAVGGDLRADSGPSPAGNRRGAPPTQHAVERRSGPAHARARAGARSPSGERRDREILAATLELLGSVGYDRMSMDAVANAARAGKATLYRRWASKPDLVVDAVRHLFDVEVAPPDTGDLRSDLLAVARTTRDLLTGPLGDAMRGVLGELSHNPDLRDAMRRAFSVTPRGGLAIVLARAAAAGTIPASADVDMIADTGISLLAMRLLVSRQSVEDGELTRLVDHVLLPAAHAPPPV